MTSQLVGLFFFYTLDNTLFLVYYFYRLFSKRTLTRTEFMSKKLLADLLIEVKTLGFERLLEMPFVGRDDQNERFFVFYHQKNTILLTFDSWKGVEIRRGAFHYQWKRHCTMEEYYMRPSLTSSGGWEPYSRGNEPDIFVGFHWIPDKDLISSIAVLKQHGDFLPKWVRSQSIDLTHYGDFLPGRGLIEKQFGKVNHKKYIELQQQRMGLLPREVRETLCVQENVPA